MYPIASYSKCNSLKHHQHQAQCSGGVFVVYARCSVYMHHTHTHAAILVCIPETCCSNGIITCTHTDTRVCDTNVFIVYAIEGYNITPNDIQSDPCHFTESAAFKASSLFTCFSAQFFFALFLFCSLAACDLR